MATTQLNVPQVFTKTCREDFHQHTPQRPYITFKLGPGKLQRLVIKVWSNDQGWCDNHLKAEDPYANSQTWFSLGLIGESTPGQKATSELYEFQRNVRASSTLRCHTHEWNLGLPIDDNYNGDEVHAWIQALSEAKGAAIGVFPCAMYPGWVNTVWKMEVMVNDINESPFSANAVSRDGRDRASFPNNIDINSGSGYSRNQSTVNLNEVININREAVKATPPDHPDLAASLNNLGNRLGDRFSRTGAMADLEEAIKICRQAVEATPPDHPDLAGWLNNLGNRLGDRYSRTGAMADLEEAIKVSRQAVKATPPDHPDLAAWLNNLGVHLGDRYSRTGAMADLEEAISVSREAVEATPANHPDRPKFLYNLGVHLYSSYSTTKMIANLEEAIDVSQEAVEATPPNDPKRPKYLNNLGGMYGDRYLEIGLVTDVEEAIKITREAVKATSLDHFDRPGYLHNLGNWQREKFLQNGLVADLDKATEMTKEAIKAISSSHPDWAMCLGSLARISNDRYLRIGSVADLDKAITAAGEALEATSPGQPDRHRYLNSLGVYLYNKYSAMGSIASLEKAIEFARETVKAIPSHDPARAAYWSNLGIRLLDKYLRTRTITNLEEAIEVSRKAVEAIPPNKPSRPKALNNLAVCLFNSYLSNGAEDNIEEAVEIIRKAIEATPANHPDRPIYMSNLGSHLYAKYSRTGMVVDLEKAIQVGRDAVEAILSNRPHKSLCINNLGNWLNDRYLRFKLSADLEEAKKYFITSLRQHTSIISLRIAAGRHFLSTPDVLSDQQAYTIAKETVKLIPLLSTRSLRNSDRRHLLSQAAGIASDAAAIAVHSDKGPATAIKLLETGRAIIAGFLFEQSDLAALKRKHPDLAQSFVDLRDLLDAPVPNHSLDTIQQQVMAIDAEANRRRDAQSRIPELLDEIRSNHGFDGFLLSASEADMVEAARYGPIVVLNVSLHRCDALVIQHSDAGSGVSGIKLLELPHLSHNDLDEHAKSPGAPNTLEWLWKSIVHPVLDFLGFNEAPPSNQWPHIWWIPTGILSHFPLHAAGYHWKRTGKTALDRVVSSYAASVKGIMRSRRRPYQTAPTGGARNAVVIPMQNTPKQQSLSYADEEIDAVSAICKSKGILDRRPRNKRDVLSALETCEIFHFAGHGGTDPLEPLHSKLLLDDWESEPFTVASLLGTNHTANLPLLAYLSACGTGQVLAQSSLDESIHLANAFQLVGFRHVIGTLWSVDDKLCVDIARLFYGYLMENMEDESVSRALHQATRTLRDKSVGGPPRDASVDGRPRDVVVSDKVEQTQPLWVPYVHFGV